MLERVGPVLETYVGTPCAADVLRAVVQEGILHQAPSPSDLDVLVRSVTPVVQWVHDLLHRNWTPLIVDVIQCMVEPPDAAHTNSVENRAANEALLGYVDTGSRKLMISLRPATVRSEEHTSELQSQSNL